MSNYIALIEVDKGGGVVRKTQVNVRDCIITDLQSARPEIEKGLERDGFEYTKRELESYYITMLAKVDDATSTNSTGDKHE